MPNSPSITRELAFGQHLSAGNSEVHCWIRLEKGPAAGEVHEII